MKTRKTALAFILMAVLAVTANAQQYDPESDFKFDWDPNVKDGVMITQYIGTKKEVRIPPSIQNYPVTSIGVGVTSIVGEGAFYGNKNITRITIPNSVISIGGAAFDNCTSVTFQGTIAADNLGSTIDGTFYSPFPGDLLDKYLASDGGPGTYVRLAGNTSWRKR